MSKPSVGISACLIGQNVRYNGKTKWQPSLITELSQHLELQPYCPEVQGGLPTPRPPVQLVQLQGVFRAAGVEQSIDATEAIMGSARRFCQRHQPVAFIFKSRSPSCGHGSTPLHDDRREVIRLGDGLFAGYLQQQWPTLLCREEQQLQEKAQQRWFIWLCQALMTKPASPDRATVNQQLKRLAETIDSAPDGSVDNASFYPLTNNLPADIKALSQSPHIQSVEQCQKALHVIDAR